ncbi:hypothetical protein HY638_04530 [Candidatus Woesearchaeota archaeon]|nr:hypothetical protein [Candidatus Woesearchaeota archaeon]
MDESILEDIGLTHAEIKVYLALLELGSSSAGLILEKSNLHNSVVHRNLDRLIEKGLITYVMEGKKKHYQAVNPKLLVAFLDEKKGRFMSVLPELLEKQKLAKKKPEAVIYRGKRGIRELLYGMLDTDVKEDVAYGGGQKSDEVMGTYFWDGFYARKIRKKIKSRLLFHESLRWWGSKMGRKQLTEVRYTSKEFEGLTETIVSGNRVGIIIWLDNPYGILIDEELAAKSYRKFFEVLWKSARD